MMERHALVVHIIGTGCAAAFARLAESSDQSRLCKSSKVPDSELAWLFYPHHDSHFLSTSCGEVKLL